MKALGPLAAAADALERCVSAREPDPAEALRLARALVAAVRGAALVRAPGQVNPEVPAVVGGVGVTGPADIPAGSAVDYYVLNPTCANPGCGRRATAIRVLSLPKRSPPLIATLCADHEDREARIWAMLPHVELR